MKHIAINCTKMLDSSLALMVEADYLNADERRLGMTNLPDDRFLTVEEVAEALRVKRRTVMEWLKNKELRGFKLMGKSWRIRESDLSAFIQQWEQTTKEG